MICRVCAVLIAPSLSEAQTESAAINDSASLFGVSISADASAGAAEIQGTAYLLILGEHDEIVAAIQSSVPDDWEECSQHHRYGDEDAGASTWLPADAVACLLLGMMG